MSRHRIVRNMNYDDERYDDDEYDYSHSYEDRYCVSPSTAAQFSFNRDKSLDLSSFIHEEKIPEEEEDSMESDQVEGAAVAMSEELSDVDRARLHSCLDELHNVLGDTVPEAVMTETVIRHNYNIETALNEIFTTKDAPKPQRAERRRRDRTQGGATAQPSPDVQPVNPAKTVSPTVVLTTPKKKPQKGFEVDANNSFVERTSSNTAAPTKQSSGAASKQNTPSAKQTSATSTSVSNGASVTDRLTEEVEAMGLTVETRGDKAKNPAVEAVVKESKPSSPRSQSPQRDGEWRPPLPKSGSKSKNDKIDAKAEYAKRQGDKELINLVVIGHVDAGKSTLMGHLLYQLGSVQQRLMHKYEQESKKAGKGSFAFAWVLDETEEERSRGVTMDVAQTRFATEKKMVTLLDAPGHKDFIPNMITGAAQADVAILVINATRGEFETGFDAGGQTREHALLARSLGVSQIIVAVNKMDTVGWDKARYDEILAKLRQFLKQVGFKEADVSFVPCSGLEGENLVHPPKEPRLTEWYDGPTLVQKIDQFKNLERPVDKPFRLSVSDVFKGATGGFSVAGRISAGYIRPGDKVLVMPAGNIAGVKNVSVDDVTSQIAFAGDHVTMMLTGIDVNSVNVGFVLCDPMSPSKCALRIRAKIVIFNLEVPITRGFPVVFHYQCVNEPAVIKRLVASLNKSTGEVVKNKPKCLTKNSSAVVEIEFERTVCVELYTEYRDLGRFMLRQGGNTIAAGLIEEVLQSKVQRDDQN